jgi:hypothetical protein
MYSFISAACGDAGPSVWCCCAQAALPYQWARGHIQGRWCDYWQLPLLIRRSCASLPAGLRRTDREFRAFIPPASGGGHLPGRRIEDWTFGWTSCTFASITAELTNNLTVA